MSKQLWQTKVTLMKFKRLAAKQMLERTKPAAKLGKIKW